MDAARNYELVAAFPDGGRARRAMDELTSRGVTRNRLRLVKPRDDDGETRVGAMRAEMQEEVAEGFGGPAVGFLTPSQAKGAISGTVLGAIAGAIAGVVVGLMWGFLAESSISPVGRVVIAAACFVIAGATGGAIIGGALKPRRDAARHPGAMLDERRLAGQADTLVAVTVTDEEEASVVQSVLEGSGASRVDALDVEGVPLPPQREHPRPADPPGRWSDPDREGG